ncbi:poly(U)-specific endoribonuclease-like protein [Cricetulus griseus]|uniref:Uridylate-specific endoribonuclease n=1 Tax=Cricetulus griseus TaxID=10029 RepID=A0A061IJ73_CRIGR|nr:poly(U)-specific endoribonuclease-like protein [Cricetulus griseus]
MCKSNKNWDNGRGFYTECEEELYDHSSSPNPNESESKLAVPGRPGNRESCASRCNEKFNRGAVCQCDRQCPQHDDCCDDYGHLCTDLYSAPNSCQGRCREAYDKHHPCHCNERCRKFGDCCEDFDSLCGDHEGFSHSSDAITNEELQSISEMIYKVDNNKARKEDIVLNSQNRVSPSETGNQVDRCPEPPPNGSPSTCCRLFTYVNEQLFSKPTYAAFINLLNNYQRATGHGEHFSAQQLEEQAVFLREVMKTAVMKELYGFLHHQNRYSSEQQFVDDLKNMWFGLYSRGSEERDSSGFEHVFSGEVKKGKVTGFHNWIRFYLQEKEGLLDYYSHNYDGPWDSYPDVLAMQFNWDGYYKEVGSAFIGSSPEFEFALYSLCFITRPGRKCHLSLGGYPLSIQTYTWDKTTYGNGKKYIATAYIVSSTQ